jgi:hypothetical protein
MPHRPHSGDDATLLRRSRDGRTPSLSVQAARGIAIVSLVALLFGLVGLAASALVGAVIG